MQLPQLTPRRARRPRRDRRLTARDPEALPTREAPERRDALDPQAAPTRGAAERRDARRGGGPQDSALYTCGCGYVFNAPVSTSVSCPHCGTDQAW